MDPGTIIAVVQISAKLIKICVDYLNTACQYSQDILSIITEVSAVRGLVETLKIVIDDKNDTTKSQILDLLKDATGPVPACQRVIQELTHLLTPPPQQYAGPTRKRDKAREFLRSVEWPFKEGKVERLLAELRQHKTTIAAVLAADSSVGIHGVRLYVEDIRDELDDSKRLDIIDWLISTDPREKHAEACDSYKDRTCTWIWEWPAWREWLSLTSVPESHRCIWVHGIPGAGKTILASCMVDSIQTFCQTLASTAPSPRLVVGWSYYYCSHTNNHDETRHFLRWVLGQLCRQGQFIPPRVRSSWRAGNGLSTKELLDALAMVVSTRFSQVFILIDAVEESQKVHVIAQVLRQLATEPRFRNVRLAITSRQDVEIARAIDDVSCSISMSSVKTIHEDIELYIDSRLATDAKLRRWPSHVLQKIKVELSANSKGMFRWAACQLDMLRLHNTEARVWQALSSLPKTLEESYERVLLAVPPESKASVIRLLAFLSVSLALPPGCRMCECIKAVLMLLDDDGDGDQEGRHHSEPAFDDFLDPDALDALCTTLIHVSRHVDQWTGESIPTYTYAHYSVREYLFSDTIVEGPAADFQLTESLVNKTVAKAVMKCLIEISTSFSPAHFDWRSFCHNRGLALLATLQSSIIQDEELFRLSCRLFSPTRLILPWYSLNTLIRFYDSPLPQPSSSTPLVIGGKWQPLEAPNSTQLFWTGLHPSQETTPGEAALHTLSNMLGLGLDCLIKEYLERCNEDEVMDILSSRLLISPSKPTTRRSTLTSSSAVPAPEEFKVGLLELSRLAGNSGLEKRITGMLQYRARAMLTES